MSTQVVHWPSFLTGSALIIGGSTIAGIFSFQNRVWIVFLGFTCFLEGYRTAQRGRDWLTPLRAPLRGTNTTKAVIREATRLFLMLIGVSIIALGVTKFAQTIIDPSALDAAVAGIYSIGGYIWAHTVLNHGLL